MRKRLKTKRPMSEYARSKHGLEKRWEVPKQKHKYIRPWQRPVSITNSGNPPLLGIETLSPVLLRT